MTQEVGTGTSHILQVDQAEPLAVLLRAGLQCQRTPTSTRLFTLILLLTLSRVFLSRLFPPDYPLIILRGSCPIRLVLHLPITLAPRIPAASTSSSPTARCEPSITTSILCSFRDS